MRPTSTSGSVTCDASSTTQMSNARCSNRASALPTHVLATTAASFSTAVVAEASAACASSNRFACSAPESAAARRRMLAAWTPAVQR